MSETDSVKWAILRVPVAVHRAAKVAAAVSGQPIYVWLARAVESQALADENARKGTE